MSGATKSGTYSVNPDGGGLVKVYCDMTAGLTLVGMVHSSNKLGVDEPIDWFAKPYYQTQISENANKHDSPPMSIGANRFEKYIKDQIAAGKQKPFMKVVIHAHDDLSQINEWWKDITDVRTYTTLCGPTLSHPAPLHPPCPYVWV